jgi:hypothetical protein
VNSNTDYIKNITKQNQRKKSVTITIDETVLDDVTKIAEELNISRNQIISDTTANFVSDYKKYNEPGYYIINSNNAYMPEGHLHMLLGNRASAWGDTKSAIDGVVPGDYLFVYMNGEGIIGAGYAETNRMINDYSLVKVKTDSGIKNEVWDEHFVGVTFEKTSLNNNNEVDKTKVVTRKEFNDSVSNKVLNRTKVALSKEEGELLRTIYLNK